MTSCKSTGRCPDGPAVRSATGRRTRSRALGTASLGHLVLDARVFLRRRLADAAPVLVVPDLDQIVDAHDPRDAGNARILPLVGGQHDPPLGVELALACRAKHHSGQSAVAPENGREWQPVPWYPRHAGTYPETSEARTELVTLPTFPHFLPPARRTLPPRQLPVNKSEPNLAGL